MCTHLHKREGGTYYFRRAVPAALRDQLAGRREWVMSLHTKDRNHAKRLIPPLTIETDMALEAARSAIQCHSTGKAAVVPRSDFGLLDALKRVIPAGSCNGPSTGIRHQARQGADGLAKSPAVPLLETFEAYAAEQKIKAATAAEWRSILKNLTAFLGHDDASQIKPEDLDRWRDRLLNERTKRGIKRDPGTVKDKYLAAIRATLNWAVEKRKVTENVALRVVVRVPRKAKLRERDFTLDESKAILSATIKRVDSKISPEAALARRWIPWLCAYTGARVNELSQLRGKDISLIEGIWTVRITPEAGTVKANVARIVPLHPHLVEQGFLALASLTRDAPLFYDPTKIRNPGDGNRYFKKVGERLRDWVRKEVGVTDPNLQPNHGWRHTFKTMMVDANISERIADAIQGHAPRSVGQTYGRVSLKTMHEAIIALPRFDIGN